MRRQHRMARRYFDLDVWKLGDEIRQRVFALTGRPPYSADFKAKGQIEDAINSVCHNIAEGFGCSTHGEHARFLEFSVRSLNEVRDALTGAQQKGYLSDEERKPIAQRIGSLFPALRNFIAYLKRTPDK